MKRILINTVLLLFVLVYGSKAQENTPAGGTYDFTLVDCINYAYQHQSATLNAGLDIKKAEYRVKEVIGSGLPQINGSANFLDYVKIPTTLLPGEFFGQPGTFIPVKFGVKYQSSFSASGSQILFDGSYLVGLKASKTYKELSQRNYSRSRIEANVAVTKAYYQVLVSNEQVRLLDANIAQIKQQLDETTQQNKQGFVEKIDVDRISVQYNDLVTNRDNVLRLLALNYQMLKFQMGMPIESNLVLKDRLEDTNLDPSIAEVQADSSFYTNRIEYRLSETQKKLNELSLQRTKTQYLPTLNGIANYTGSYQNNTFGNLYSAFFPSSYIGLSLNVPIFSGGQRLNQVRQSAITVRQSENDLYNLKNAIKLEVSQARVNYINGLQTLNAQKRNRELAEEILRVSRIKYQQGVGSSIEVTQAQTALAQANNSYIQGLFDALVSRVDLDKAYGRIQ